MTDGRHGDGLSPWVSSTLADLISQSAVTLLRRSLLIESENSEQSDKGEYSMLTTVIAFASAGEEIDGSVGGAFDRVARVESTASAGRFFGILIGTGEGILFAVLMQHHDNNSAADSTDGLSIFKPVSGEQIHRASGLVQSNTER